MGWRQIFMWVAKKDDLQGLEAEQRVGGKTYESLSDKGKLDFLGINLIIKGN